MGSRGSGLAQAGPRAAVLAGCETCTNKPLEKMPETRWIDAQIRWDDAVNNELEQSNCIGDETDLGGVGPLFADPHPQETFVFTEQPTTRNSEHNNEEESIIDIRLDGFKADADQVWQSTGLTLWNAAIELSRYLIQHSELVLAKTILELGAGLGLCGIVAHQLQARTNAPNTNGSFVYLTDGDTDALKKLRQNVQTNQRSERIVCEQLLWGAEQAKEFEKNHGKMDIVLASDVVYVASIVPLLWQTVKSLLKQSEGGGIFIFAFDSRRDVPVTIEYVLEESERAGFCYEKTSNNLYLFRWSKMIESVVVNHFG